VGHRVHRVRFGAAGVDEVQRQAGALRKDGAAAQPPRKPSVPSVNCNTKSLCVCHALPSR